MSRVRKVVAAVKEIDTEGKIKLGFSGIVARGDINKEENIVSTNNRLEKYCKGNESCFIDNSNIDASYLNKSKLHLNRKGTYYLANNFRKYILTLNEIFMIASSARRLWIVYTLLVCLWQLIMIPKQL